MPALEAAACGLPLIVSGGGPTDEFTTPEFARRLRTARVPVDYGGGRGWMLAPDAADLAAAMADVVANGTFRAGARRAGPAHVAAAGLSWEAVAARLVGIARGCGDPARAALARPSHLAAWPPGGRVAGCPRAALLTCGECAERALLRVDVLAVARSGVRLAATADGTGDACARVVDVGGGGGGAAHACSGAGQGGPLDVVLGALASGVYRVTLERARLAAEVAGGGGGGLEGLQTHDARGRTVVSVRYRAGVSGARSVTLVVLARPAAGDARGGEPFVRVLTGTSPPGAGSCGSTCAPEPVPLPAAAGAPWHAWELFDALVEFGAADAARALFACAACPAPGAASVAAAAQDARPAWTRLPVCHRLRFAAAAAPIARSAEAAAAARACSAALLTAAGTLGGTVGDPVADIAPLPGGYVAVPSAMTAYGGLDDGEFVGQARACAGGGGGAGRGRGWKGGRVRVRGEEVGGSYVPIWAVQAVDALHDAGALRARIAGQLSEWAWSPSRRVRVGFVSANMYKHSVGRALAGVVASLAGAVGEFDVTVVTVARPDEGDDPVSSFLRRAGVRIAHLLSASPSLVHAEVWMCAAAPWRGAAAHASRRAGRCCGRSV